MKDFVRNDFDDAFDSLSNLYVPPVEDKALEPLAAPDGLISFIEEPTLDSILNSTSKNKILNE